MDNGEGIDCGEGGELGGGEQKGKNWDNCNRISNKKIFSLFDFLFSFPFEFIGSSFSGISFLSETSIRDL